MKLSKMDKVLIITGCIIGMALMKPAIRVLRRTFRW